MFNNKLKRELEDLKDTVDFQGDIIHSLLEELNYDIDFCDCCDRLVLKDK